MGLTLEISILFVMLTILFVMLTIIFVMITIYLKSDFKSTNGLEISNNREIVSKEIVIITNIIEIISNRHGEVISNTTGGINPRIKIGFQLDFIYFNTHVLLCTLFLVITRNVLFM